MTELVGDTLIGSLYPGEGLGAMARDEHGLWAGHCVGQWLSDSGT